MRESVSKSITNTIQDLYKSGLVDEITMKNIESLCLPEIKEFTPERIRSMRKKFKLSQNALARLLNVNFSTVQKWEQGLKKPNGSSRKLLDLIERKGIEVLI